MRDPYDGRAMRRRLAGTNNTQQGRKNADTYRREERAALCAGERLTKRLSSSSISHHV
jgi:hypothetical protein